MSSFIRLIATSPSEQEYCVRELYAALLEARDGKPQKTGNGNGNGVAADESIPTPAFTEGLTLAGSWVLGEYGHKLLNDGKAAGHEIIALVESVLESPYNSQIMNEYAINALMKLSTRLPANEGQHNNVATITRILRSHTDSLDVEIQQRSAEYSNMFLQPIEVRVGVFENMPAPEIREENRVLGEATLPKIRRGGKKDQESALMDILGDEVSGPSNANPGSGGGNLDLLNDILGGMDTSSSPASPAPGQQKSNISDILDLFGPGPSAPTVASPPPQSTMGHGLFDAVGGPQPTTPQAPATPSTTVYTKNNMEIALQVQRQADGAVYIRAKLANSSFTETLEDIQLQAAAPRGQKLELKEISSAVLPPAGDAHLQMRLSESKGVCTRR